MTGQKVGIYAVLHFLVDFCCALFMYRLATITEYFYIYFLIYNFCAFALQMPVGLLADKWNYNSIVAGAGCFLTGITALAATFLLAESNVMWMYPVAVILAGIGNCLFHVGGGIEILNESGKKLSPLGIFVSPGAIGIYLGTMLGKKDTYVSSVPFLMLILGGILLLWWHQGREKEFRSQNVSLKGEWAFDGKIMLVSLLSFFVVVVLRSHLGMIFSFPWKMQQIGAVLALVAVVGGKVAGGFLADKTGIGNAILLSMSTAILCFGFAGNMVLGVLGLFFFNMSMPITLYLAAMVLNRCKGFAFGVLTFAIFVGFLPAYFGYRKCTEVILVVVGAASLLFLSAGWWMIQKKEQDFTFGKDRR